MAFGISDLPDRFGGQDLLFGNSLQMIPHLLL
jgi:hypothetical protein